MSEDVAFKLSEEFDAAFVELASARASYEDEPRDSERVAALGAARQRLEAARSAIADERHRLGLETPWRIQPADVGTTTAPPIWSIDHGSGA